MSRGQPCRTTADNGHALAIFGHLRNFEFFNIDLVSNKPLQGGNSQWLTNITTLADIFTWMVANIRRVKRWITGRDISLTLAILSYVLI